MEITRAMTELKSKNIYCFFLFSQKSCLSTGWPLHKWIFKETYSWNYIECTNGEPIICCLEMIRCGVDDPGIQKFGQEETSLDKIWRSFEEFEKRWTERRKL